MYSRSICERVGGRVLAVVLATLLATPTPTWAGGDPDPLTQEQLEQLVAPIALYPDSLLAQVLMASTYPLEVVEAARWVKANPDLEGKALEDALEKQSWDASVKSLTAFPQTLEMMNDKLDWTTDLGNAFLAQQEQVMSAVQTLRQKAKKEGNLESNEQQTVKVEEAPSASQTQTQTIIIEPANPQVVYVPTYNPTVVYGPWPYPAYRPFYWYPPGYAFVGSAISFGVGMAVGSALWGGCNWGRGDVNINVNKYNNFNRTNINNSNWNHNSNHRRGVGYRDQGTREKFGGRDQARRQQSRDSFRGRAQQGRRDIARGDADRFKGNNARSGNVGGSRGNLGSNRGGSRQQNLSRGRSPSSGSGVFGGSRSGSDVRRNSSRGRSSRGSFQRSGGGGGHSFGGGSRGGGGRSFSGGGGRRGGGGGGRRR